MAATSRPGRCIRVRARLGFVPVQHANVSMLARTVGNSAPSRNWYSTSRSANLQLNCAMAMSSRLGLIVKHAARAVARPAT